MRRDSRRGLFHQVSARDYWVWGGSALAALFALWWTVTALQLVSPYFLPSPAAVLGAFTELWGDGTLQGDLAISLQRIAIGFSIATLFALPVGILMGTVWRFEAAVEPIVDFIRYMPAVSFVPLTIVWLGVGEGQKYSILFIGTFFQQALMVMDNVKRTPREYVQVGQTLGMKTLPLLGRIVLPYSAPAIWDTIRITLGWGWTWLVIAELVAAESGLGHRIIVAQRYFHTDRIFMIIILIGVIGLVIDQAMRAIDRAWFGWSRGGAR
ncbi:ABC transporter permease [Homoserinimonas sp. OAct 916]|uniref:ABC transporter permease n=1 Tax=Homoserinimonas sp. OAct 916 TaxID=2211450 RepID=UPI000DBE6C3A|nr:ABC transporter permease [Homoserinimonas sp. OAct 916]